MTCVRKYFSEETRWEIWMGESKIFHDFRIRIQLCLIRQIILSCKLIWIGRMLELKLAKYKHCEK